MSDPALVVRVAANLSEFKSNLAEGVSQIETYKSALSSAASAYDGSRIVAQASAAATAIQNAGGVATLTASEMAKANTVFTDAAAKLQLMGQGGTYAAQRFTELADATKKIPPAQHEANESLGQFGELVERITERLTIYEVLREGFSFAKEAIESTAKLEEMALATGITADGLQRLGYVTREFGIDSDQMTRGIEQLSAKLAGGDKNATTAVELLNLNVKTLLSLGPEEAFIQIAEAAGRIDDPMTKGAIAADLFGGRLAKQLIPALGELRQKIDDVPKDALISQANITAAHDFEVALDHVETRLKSWTVSVLGVASSYNTWLESGTGLSGFMDMIHGKTPVATKDTTEHGESVEKAAESTIHLTETVKERIAAEALAAEELKKYTAAMIEIDSAGVGWRGTLNTINGSVAEAVRFYLEAGVAQDKLATAYGLTASQVKSVASAMKDENEQLKLQAAATQEVTRLWDEFDQIASKGGTAFDDQVAAIDRWALDLEAKAQKAGTDTAQFYEALTALWSAKLHQAAAASESSMQEAASVGISAFQSMNDAVMGLETSFDGWNDSIMAVDRSLKQVAADQAALAKGNTLDVGTAAQDPLIMELLHQGWSLKNAEAIKLSRQYGFAPQLYDAKGNPESAPSPGERVPGYADGVMNAPGGWATVGERGPERMYVPPGANIYPNGSSAGGPSIVNHIYVTQPLGSPDAIARAVDDALMQRQRNTGQRF